jgi:hypothetical protein
MTLQFYWLKDTVEQKHDSGAKDWDKHSQGQVEQEQLVIVLLFSDNKPTRKCKASVIGTPTN